MPENRYKPRGKWIVQAVADKLEPFTESAIRLRWRSFSPEMWRLYIGWIRALQQRAIWREYPPELHDLIVSYGLEQEPPETECPPEPPPPAPPEQPPATGGGAAAVGSFGLSIEELEGLLMGSVMDIRIYQGKLQVQYFPCCDWVDVGSISALAQQVTSGMGSTSIQDAIAQGVANFAPIKITPPSQAGFDNATTRQCAKATAMKYVVLTYLVDLRNYLDEALGDLTAVLATLAAFVFVTPLAKLIPAGTVGYLLKQLGKEELIAFIDEFIADEALWNDFVCTVAADLSSADEITGQDVTAFYQWMLTNAIIAHEEILELVTKITFTEFQGQVGYAVSYAGCECDEYLPAGYTPPTPEGTLVFNFEQFAEGSTWGVNPTWLGGAYADAFDAGSTGQLVSGRPKGIQNFTTPPNFESAFSAHYHLSSPAEITQLKVAWSFPAGEAAVRLHIMCLPTGSEVWEYFDGAYSDEAAPFATTLTSNHVGIEITDFIVILNTYYPHDGPQKPAHLTSILMSGEFLGNTFSELGIGETYTP